MRSSLLPRAFQSCLLDGSACVGDFACSGSYRDVVGRCVGGGGGVNTCVSMGWGSFLSVLGPLDGGTM